MRINNKLMLSFFLIAIIPAMAMFAIIYYKLYHDYEKKEMQAIENRVAQTARTIDGIMNTLIEDTRALSLNPMFYQLSPEEISRYFAHRLAYFPYYSNFYFTNATGIIIASSNQSSIGKQLMKLQPDINGLLKKTVQSPPGAVFVHDMGNMQVEILCSAVGRTGQGNGTLVSILQNSMIHNLIKQVDYRTKGSDHTYLMDCDGHILLTDDPTAASMGLHPDMKRRELLAEMVGSLQGALSYTDFQGQKVVAGHVRFGQYNNDRSRSWLLISTTPYRDIMAPINQTFTHLAEFFLAVCVIIVALCSHFSRTLSRPICMLTETVSQFGEGEMRTRSEIRSRDEIGKLSEQFNNMAEKIEKYTIEHKQREKELQRQAQMLDLANDVIIICDFKDRITYWNHAAELQYGWTAGEASGQYANELLKTVFQISHDKFTAALLQNGKWEGEVVQTHRNGSQLTIWSRLKLLTDDENRILGVLEINRDITERKRAEEEIRSLSLIDELTGIYNRRGFMTLAQQELKIAHRMKKSMTLFFADIDGLKWINDNLGHENGDMAIRDATQMLKITFRESDIIARLGGDEFAIVTTDTSPFNANTLISRLQFNIDTHNKKNNRPYRLSMSIGVVRHDLTHPQSLDGLLSQADHLMYEQKRRKRELIKIIDYRKVS